MMEMEARPDEGARCFALQSAQWFYEATDTKPASPADLLHTATIIEHYITDGETTVIECPDHLRKYIR